MAEADRIKVYLTLFRHASLDVDWDAFSAELGISLKNNAQRKFKDCLKKDGYQMANGKIGPIGEVLEDGGNASLASTPKRKSKQTKQTKSPAKKRKVEQIDEEDDSGDDVAKEEVTEEA